MSCQPPIHFPEMSRNHASRVATPEHAQKPESQTGQTSMSKHCKYGRRATSNTEAMTARMAATFTGIQRHKIERHREGKCACAKPTEQGTK